MARHVHHEAMADAARSAQAAFAAHHSAHQLVCVQAAFHQGIDLAAQGHRDRRIGRGMAVRRIDDGDVREIDADLLRSRFDLRARADQRRCDEAQRGGRKGRLQRHGIGRMNHRDAQRRQAARCGDQTVVVRVCSERRRRHAGSWK